MIKSYSRFFIPILFSLMLISIIYSDNGGLQHRPEYILPAIAFRSYSISPEGSISLLFSISKNSQLVAVDYIYVILDNKTINITGKVFDNNKVVFNVSSDILYHMCVENKRITVGGSLKIKYLNYTVKLTLNKIYLRYNCDISLNISVVNGTLVIDGKGPSWLKDKPIPFNLSIRLIRRKGLTSATIYNTITKLYFNGTIIRIGLPEFDEGYFTIKYMVNGRMFLRSYSIESKRTSS